MRSHLTNDAVIATSNQRIGATQKYLTHLQVEIPVDGRRLKPAELVALYARSLETRATVLATEGQYKAALADRDDVEAQRRGADDALKVWVLHWFGANSQEAHEFGFAARKVPEISAETKAKAVLLNKATRKARGTVGRKAKLKIKGTLDAEDEDEEKPVT